MTARTPVAEDTRIRIGDFYDRGYPLSYVGVPFRLTRAIWDGLINKMFPPNFEAAQRRYQKMTLDIVDEG